MYSGEDLERFYVKYQSERVPRRMAMRKVIQHCGSDEGEEMGAVYLIMVSTVSKLPF